MYFGDAYLWFKAIHLIAMVAWMAGLFYLPRLFVYHANAKDAVQKQTFVMMEEKLYRIIMTPAMHTTLLFGVLMVVWNPANIKAGWFHVKVTCVIGLVVYQFALNHFRHQFAQGTCQKTHTYFRFLNEVPTVLLIIIIIAAVIRPF
jgi:putative membrane protein